MRRAALALPVVFLALSLDRACDEPPAAPVVRPAAPLATALASLPGLNRGRLGRRGNSLNIVFVGREEAVRAALTGAGWTEVPLTIRASLYAGAKELLSGRRLAASPPMNDYYLEGRRQAMNWAIPVRHIHERHHFRLWDSGRRDERGRAVWWGTGDYDLKVRWHDLSHVPDPEMNRERDYLAQTLEGSALVENVSLVPLAQIPREGANDKGYPFRNDGRALVIELKD